jgi:N-methylhydantoinase B
MTEKSSPQKSSSSVRFMPRTDPTTFEVLRHRLWQINDEQGKTLLNMSGSQIATEANDFNVGIADAEGNLIVVGPYILVQMAPLTVLVQSVIRTIGDDVTAGDVFLCNDPWFGAVHQNDVCVLAPFFWEGKVTAWTASVVHQVDVGGGTPGSWCREATDTFQEAPRYRFLRVVRGGVLQRDVVDTYLTNSRTPELLNLDLRAQIGSARATLGRLKDLFERYGSDVVHATMHDMQDYAERLFANKLETIPSGEWLSDCYLDHDGRGESTHRYALRLKKDDSGLTFDYTETDPQIPAFINCAYAGLFSATYIGVLVYLCADIPWNSGVMRRVRILSNEGSLNNARFPAAVSGSLESIWNSTNAACAALGKMLCASEQQRSSAMAVWQGSTCVYTLFGTNQYGERYGSWMISSSLGGGGARSFGDGHDTSGPLMAPCYSAINVEHAESLYPMLFLYRKRAADSAGPGKWRGGVSADHAITPHGTEEIAIGVTSSGADHSHTLGLVGGYPGAGSTVRIARGGMPGSGHRDIPADWQEIAGEKDVLAPKTSLSLKAGDVFSTIPHGGGGFGDPLDRDPELVLRDVGERIVSRDGACDHYGVVIASEALRVDTEATERLRADIRGGRVDKAGRGAAGQRANGGDRVRPRLSGIVQVEEHWACGACGTSLGSLAENAKDACSHRYKSLAAAGPLIAPRSRGESKKFRLSEYSCPVCATLLAVDQTLKTTETRWHDVRAG